MHRDLAGEVIYLPSRQQERTRPDDQWSARAVGTGRQVYDAAGALIGGRGQRIVDRRRRVLYPGRIGAERGDRVDPVGDRGGRLCEGRLIGGQRRTSGRDQTGRAPCQQSAPCRDLPYLRIVRPA